MGKRGPKKEDHKLKVLKGNPGKKPLNDKYPKPDPINPPPPRWLGHRAKQTWESLAPKLYKDGMLTERDLIQLRNLCITDEILQVLYKSVKDKLKELTFTTENGYQQQIPELNALDKYMKQIHRFADRFGLDPISRQSLVTPKDQEEDDPIAQMLKKKKGG